MTLLRSFGSRFRRDENEHYNFGDSGVAIMSKLQVHNAHSSGYLASKLTSLHHSEESPDLYYEDRELGSTIHALEDVRASLNELTSAANEHKDMLCAAASSQRRLGEELVGTIEARISPGRSNDNDLADGLDNFSDLHVGAKGQEEDDTFEANSENHIAKFLSDNAIEAQKVLGQSFVAQAGAMIKLGIALSNPINELQNSFEERFGRKIVPLRRRYVDQKGQYLKYMRQSDAAEEDERRSYYDALAQAAKPVWVRTSKELRMEAHVMTELTARNIAKWSKTLALQHERSLAIAAANFSEAITRAKGR